MVAGWRLRSHLLGSPLFSGGFGQFLPADDHQIGGLLQLTPARLCLVRQTLAQHLGFALFLIPQRLPLLGRRQSNDI